MNDKANSRLSQIETLWSVVRRAHEPENRLAISAQQQLLEIYGGAIKRYLYASLRDTDVADDLFQDFAIKFVKGDFRNADPDRGRFRFYVKRSIHNLIQQHLRKSAKHNAKELVLDPIAAESETQEQAEDKLFLSSWREDVLDKTWQALAMHEQRTGVTYYSVLKMRVDNPMLSSDEFASRLAEDLGKPMNSGTARVNLHRAREKFAKLMLETIAASIEEPTRDAIESELIELGLIDYCREFLDSV